MASTNKTTNYDLSQYVGSDKPSYLNDYNQDMNKIDLGIHAAKSEADTNASAIGDLSDLTTTAKSDLVSAINEVDSEASTANATAVQADGKADTNATAIGTLANLTTNVKSNLVSATNEVNAKINALPDFNLTRFENITFVGDGADNFTLTLASNEDYSIYKLYGYGVYSPSRVGDVIFTAQTSLRPTAAYSIAGFGLAIPTVGGGITRPASVEIKTNGEVVITVYNDQTTNGMIMYAPPCIYFNKSFGD